MADVVFDPVLKPHAAADYLGCCTRQLRRLNLDRQPLPTTGGRPSFGYRLSTLNAYLDRLRDPKARTPLTRRKAS